jgi:hypothetical protein
MPLYQCAPGAAIAALVCSSTATAALILPGDYQLDNHPAGTANPPAYGLTVAGIDGSSDRFTFSFSQADGADMILRYDDVADTIRIFGNAFGGRDGGNDWVSDSYLGTYFIDFTFDVGVGLAPGDDDLVVIASTESNFGTLQLPDSTVLDLYDVFSDDFGHSFRFGDTDDDSGHRDFDGLSGWGWVEVDGMEDSTVHRDWIFTAQYIPAPAAAALLAVFGVVPRRRRS